MLTISGAIVCWTKSNMVCLARRLLSMALNASLSERLSKLMKAFVDSERSTLGLKRFRSAIIFKFSTAVFATT